MANAEKAQPVSEIEILGEKRKFKFSTLAFVLIERESGIDALAGDMFKRLDATMTSLLLWAGLKGEGSISLTLEEFRKQITPVELQSFRVGIMQGMEAASPPEKKPESEPVPAVVELTEAAISPQEQTGSLSGQ